MSKRYLFTSLAVFCLFTLSLAYAQQDELLPPEQAFDLQAWMDGDRLIAEYTIAPGYYMYRERFDFQIDSDKASFDTAIIPNGKIKNDEFFGDMEVYRGRLRIELPLQLNTVSVGNLTARFTGQGCADIGVCYPPLTQALEFNTQSSARFYPTAYTSDLNQFNQTRSENADLNFSESIETGAISILQSLGDEFGISGDDDIPHPDTAFRLSARLEQNNIIQTSIKIIPNTYLYRDKMEINLVDGKGHSLGFLTLPSGDTKNDEFFGNMEVYHEQVNISIPIISGAGASEKFTLAFQYQGCVEDRICYPPITKILSVNHRTGLIDIADQSTAQGPTDNRTGISVSSFVVDASEDLLTSALPISEQDRFAKLLFGGHILLVVALFFVAGIALTFTPCVFPMIPILSSIIAGQGETITTRKAFLLSLVYVLSMATTYAIIGAIVGYYGAEFNIQIWFQDPWILSIFAAIFVLLALSMFGFYELQVPGAIQSRLVAISHSQQGGTMIGVGLMGIFSAIIVGPCITAPLVGALIFISQTQDWQLGGLALFALGLGMGVPLLIVGTSAGKLFPKAGAWMELVKSVFGVILLGVAIYLLERFLPVPITMALIACLIIGSAVYMGALEALPAAASGWRKLSKGLGIILLLYGASFLLGAAAGSRDLILPLKGIILNAGGGNPAGLPDRIEFRQIRGTQGLQLALANSVRLNQPTMLDFYADWCISCKVMEKYAFTHSDVLRALDNVASLQADVTDNDSIDTQLMGSLGIYGPPAILFFDPTGTEIRHRRVVGEMSGEAFAEHIIETVAQIR